MPATAILIGANGVGSTADAFFDVPDLVRPVRPGQDRRSLKQLTALIKEQQYQIVHTHCSKAGLLGRMAARRAGVPIVVHTYHAFGWQVLRSGKPQSAWRRPAAAIEEACLRRVGTLCGCVE